MAARAELFFAVPKLLVPFLGMQAAPVPVAPSAYLPPAHLHQDPGVSGDVGGQFRPEHELLRVGIIPNEPTR